MHLAERDMAAFLAAPGACQRHFLADLEMASEPISPGTGAQQGRSSKNATQRAAAFLENLSVTGRPQLC